MTVEELVQKLTRNTSWAKKEVVLVIEGEIGGQWSCSVDDVELDITEDQVMLVGTEGR